MMQFLPKQIYNVLRSVTVDYTFPARAATILSVRYKLSCDNFHDKVEFHIFYCFASIEIDSMVITYREILGTVNLVRHFADSGLILHPFPQNIHVGRLSRSVLGQKSKMPQSGHAPFPQTLNLRGRI